MEKELFLAIITNGILLLSMGILYTFLPLEKNKNRRYYEILIGVLLSFVVLLLMSTTFTISADKGVVLDTRSILLSISTFFFGIIPGLIAMVVASIYRIILGGGGTLTGVLVIVTSVLIGYLFRHLYYEKVKNTKIKREIVLYILSLITHITMMILFLFLPKEVRVDVITVTAPYVLIIYPIIGVLFGTLIFQRQDSVHRNEQRIDYLEQFKDAIKNAPIPMMIQQEDGQIILFSKAWLKLSGYDENEIDTLEKWVTKVYPKKDHTETLDKINKLFSINEPFYEGEFKIKAKNGEYLVWDFYSSSIGTVNGNKKAVLSIANDVTNRIKLEEELRTLSFKDELTGLYNRRFYEEEIRRLNTKRNYPITLLLGDVNHLKEVNDNYGHIEGDNLLKTVAKALKDTCREDDIIARMGGDEFIMILPQTNEEDAEKIIERLYAELEKHSIKDIQVSVSFGQSTLDSSQTNVENAFIEAEDEMYIQKEEFSKKGK